MAIWINTEYLEPVYFDITVLPPEASTTINPYADLSAEEACSQLSIEQLREYYPELLN